MTAADSHQEEWDAPDEAAAEFAARLTQAAYAVALKHGVGGSFADLELAMWRELRAVVATTARPAAGVR